MTRMGYLKNEIRKQVHWNTVKNIEIIIKVMAVQQQNGKVVDIWSGYFGIEYIIRT